MEVEKTFFSNIILYWWLGFVYRNFRFLIRVGETLQEWESRGNTVSYKARYPLY